MDEATRKRMEEALRRVTERSVADLRAKTPQSPPAASGK
jgi:hypothetical protein